MSYPPGPYPPTNELVAIAWLGQRVDGIVEGQVATTLPKDKAAWADEGFVQVQALPGGSPDIDVPLRRPVLQVDLWAVTLDANGNASNKPPWNKANRLAELLRLATESQAYGKPVTLPDGYRGARVQAAYLIGEPTRVTDDPSGYARFTVDLALDWVPQ